MSKNATIGAVIIGIVVVGAIIYALSSGDSAMMKKDDAMMEKDASAAGDTMLVGSEMNESGIVGGDAMVEEGAMMKDGDAAMEKGDTMMKDDGAMMKKGSYEPYAAEKLALASSGDVVLFFHASWCPICKALEGEILSNPSAIPDGVTILKVDFDNAAELRKKYGVTVQHTFVQVRADGTLIHKWSDSTSLAAALKKVQ